MANSESELVEEEELIKQQAEIENKLDDLLKERMETLSRIRDIVREQSGLEQELDRVNGEEDELGDKMKNLKKEIGDISREIAETGEERKLLEIHKKKTELIQELLNVEENMGNVTREKVGILDKIKKLTKNRSELEVTLDGVEKEKMKLKGEISDLKEKTQEFMDSMSREIIERDSGEAIEIKAEKGVEKAQEMKGEKPEEKLEEKPEEKRGLLGMLGKQKPKKEFKTEIGMDDLLDMGLLKKVLGIMDNLLEKLPEGVIDEFSGSKDFNRYEEFYNTIKGYNGKPDQREYIDKNVKDILGTIANLLKKLPEDVIDEFSRSKDFDIYRDILSKYGVK